MNARSIVVARGTTVLCVAAILLATGCKKMPNRKPGLTAAINAYYSTHPACLWTDPVQFPAQVDKSDANKTAEYDALVDQGLLVRTGADASRVDEQEAVNRYDVSDKGRSVWTADAQKPGYGDFCYGHRDVSSIDSWTPTDGSRGSTSVVDYHYTVKGAPAWATAIAAQNVFPRLHADLNGPQADQAVLMSNGPGHGWQVTSVRQMQVPGADGDASD